MEDVNSTEVKKSLFNFNPKDNPVGFVAFLFFAFLAFGAISIFMLNTRAQESQDNNATEKRSSFKPLADNAIVYGFWTGEESKINAANLKNGNIYELASLPTNIKKVTVTSPNSLIFIDKTDVRDHGKEIASYNTDTKQITPLIRFSDNFGIDDYMISPNKKYIAIWEVSFPEGKGLSVGKSRVYTANIDSPNTKNLIYDENIIDTTYAHYPISITDSGEVFLDTFKPNAGAGWANGMSYADFTGSSKQDLASMPSGSYGTQPKSSPDGRYLAFAGYDGSRGAGVVAAAEGFRQAILSPNTLEILDTTTKERTKVGKLSNQNIYPLVDFDEDTNNVIFTQLSKDVSQSGKYSYDITLNTIKKIDDIGEGDIEFNYSFITSLSDSKYLAGQEDLATSSLGNLGKTYSSSINELGVYSVTDRKLYPLAINSSLIQYIGTFNSSYFSSSLPFIGTIGDNSNRISTDQLQLQTFVVKPTLEPQRLTQQSDPPPPEEGITPTPGQLGCEDLTKEYCAEQLDGGYKPGETENRMQDDDFIQCMKRFPRRHGGCSDSPLYLYGKKGQSINISIGTQVSNSNAPYSNGYSGYLLGNGGIQIAGKDYQSLEYDYIHAIKKLLPPDYGKTVKVSEVEGAIREYGQRLDLNSKEINDTIVSLKDKFTSEYVFVSFYDDKTSKAILPISFDPKPDVYRNVVFFLKPVNEPIVAKAPVFEKYPERKGFTAVEVSYIID